MTGKNGALINMVKQRNHLLALIPEFAAIEMADKEKYRLVHKYVP